MKLWRYIQGDRKGKEAHRIEKEAMKDPFLADALEGYEDVHSNQQREVAKLQRDVARLQKRIAKKSANKPTNYLKAWSIAASILIAVGIGAWFLLEDTLAPKDLYTNIQTAKEDTPAAVPEPIPEIPEEELDIVISEDRLSDQSARKEVSDTKKREVQEQQEATVTIIQEDENDLSVSATKDLSVSAIIEEEINVEKEEAIIQKKEATTPVPQEAPATAMAQTLVEDAANPSPVSGMEAYMDYIRRNLKHPTDEECRNVKGSVVVAFKIGQSGRPYNIRVTQGLCSSINKEAIRLIINGPNWKKGTASDEATITIQF